ncbi:MAG: Rpn family recombination-promoting nuclease/putative transposase [Magnetococcales bacterium]|nr:Rpn family recombination-promoting nuclease/putative transposase [Magnetococcales bacterium]
MSEISQPHDRLFKALLSSPDTAGALLRERLPPEVAELLASERNCPDTPNCGPVCWP